MTQFQIPNPIEIPFYDHGGTLMETIRNSSRRRRMNPIYFAYRKFRNIILYRLSFFCPFNSLRIRMHRWRGVHIGQHCHIAQQCSIDNAYPELVFIEDSAGVNQGTTIIAHTNAGAHFEDIIPNIAAPVVIRHHAICAINTVILPGVEIGEYAIVAAGSVVNKNIPAYSLAQGNPAKAVFNYERIVKRNIKNHQTSDKNE